MYISVCFICFEGINPLALLLSVENAAVRDVSSQCEFNLYDV